MSLVLRMLQQESHSMSNDKKNLKILIATAVDIITEEMMPHIGNMAIHDCARLNEFLMDARLIVNDAIHNKEIDSERRKNRST